MTLLLNSLVCYKVNSAFICLDYKKITNFYYMKLKNGKHQPLWLDPITFERKDIKEYNDWK